VLPSRLVNDSVTIYMEANPEVVWGLVTDVARIGVYSPETFEAEWLDGASGPAVGARFRGHVRRNGRWPVYWTTCKVVSSDPGREFGFSVMMGKRPANTWTYRLEPRGSGTDVTESFRLADNLGNRIYWKIAGNARGRTNVEGMRRTLERMKAAAESPDRPDKPRPS
jgi:hypothetical protein